MGDLAHGSGGLPDRLGQLLIAEPEHLVEHEDRALGRGERLEHQQHRRREAVGERHILRNVRAGQEWLGQPRTDIVLPATRGRPHLVQRRTGDDPDQEGPRIPYLGLDRKSVASGKSVSVRVALGGRWRNKKKKYTHIKK